MNPNYPEINFYALEPIEDKPYEIIINESKDSNFRINQIKSYHDFMNSELLKHHRYSSLFKKFEVVFMMIEFLLLVGEMFLTTWSIIYNNNTIIPISLFITTLSTLLRSATMKLTQNLEKQNSLYILTKSRFCTVQEKFNNAMQDGNITHPEFLSIVKEFRVYEELRDKIIKNEDLSL